MREIKFRGERIDNNEFIFGDLVSNNFFKVDTNENVYEIIELPDHGDCPEDFEFHEVSPKSLSQFTGFQDSKGNDIYENDVLTDVVETDEGNINSSQKVFWNQFTGSWHLDNSFSQNQSSSTELWIELNQFKYTINK